MSRRNVSIISQIALMAVLGFVFTIASCKKSPSQATQPPAVQPAGDLEPIIIVLPKPVFIGTPEKVVGITNLEKPLGKTRFTPPKGQQTWHLKSP
jgi:hypothetical protein